MELESTLIVISLSVLAFGLISNKSSTHSVTAPMVFVTFGLVGYLLGFVKVDLSHEFIHGFLEITLILVLFTDASRIKLHLLVKQYGLPLRMLFIGMPLTILLGGFVAQWIFGFESIWFAFLLAAILAPTDAALGQAVVSSKDVPVRIRQTLNVESGLNDGIALPIILVILALTKISIGLEGHGDNGVTHWLLFSGKQIIFGPLAGILVGYCGGKLISLAARSGWMHQTFQELGLLCLSFLSFGFAESVGGNGFIAAFCAGLTVGNTAINLCKYLYEFAEAQGQLLTLCVFLLLGSVILPQFHSVSLFLVVLYAVLSLTLFRMLPVSFSLWGVKLRPQSHLFLGWFGPRGLASVLFGLLMLKELEHPATELIFSIILATVFLSIFLHGMTAGPLSKLYGASLNKKAGASQEHLEVDEMPLKLKV